MSRDVAASLNRIITKQIKSSPERFTRLVKVLDEYCLNYGNKPNNDKSVKESLGRYASNYYFTDEKDTRIFYIGKMNKNLRTDNTLKVAFCELTHIVSHPTIERLSQYLKDKEIDPLLLTNNVPLGDWIYTCSDFAVSDNGTVKIKHSFLNDSEQNLEDLIMLRRIVFFKDLNKVNTFIRNHCPFNEKNAINEGYLARRFVLSITEDGSGLIDASSEEKPRIAFPLNLYSDNGDPYYVVLMPNPKYHELKRQYWINECISYPGDPETPEIGNWLKTHFTTYSHQTNISVYNQLISLLSEIDKLAPTVVDSLQKYLNEVGEGKIHLNSCITHLLSYEEKLSELNDLMSTSENILCDTIEDVKNHLAFKYQSELSVNDTIACFRTLAKKVHEFIVETYHVTNTDTTPQRDLDTLEMALSNDNSIDFNRIDSILAAYNALALTMNATELDESIEEKMEIVSDHFIEIPRRSIRILNNPLLEISEIEKLRFQILDNIRISESNTKPKSITERSVITHVIGSPNDFKRQWISLYNSLGIEFNSIENIQYLIPESLCAMVDEQTKEKVLLLSAIINPEYCIPALLEFYRNNNDFEMFNFTLKLYQGFLDKEIEEYLTDDDNLFRMRKLIEHGSLTEEEYTFINNMLVVHPEWVNNANQEWIQQNLHLPTAFYDMIDADSHVCNVFEDALISRDVDAVYNMLDNLELMNSLGYSNDLLVSIRNAVDRGLSFGNGSFVTAYRVYSVQGDLNHTASSLFWKVRHTKGVPEILFDIYYSASKYDSALWIAKTLHAEITVPFNRLANYVYCLVVDENSKELSKWIMKDPILKYVNGVLPLIAEEPETSVLSRYGYAINEYDSEHPFEDMCDFERSICSGDVDVIEKYTDNPNMLSNQGYNEEEIQLICKTTKKYSFDKQLSALQRALNVYNIQHNHNRTFERLLFLSVNEDKKAVIQKLYELYFEEKRWYDVALFYEGYSQTLNVDTYSVYYLWSLLYIGEEEKLLKVAESQPRLLCLDNEIYRAIEEVANKHQDIIDFKSLQLSIAAIPRNPFEIALINYNRSALTDYISNNTKLLELGYSHEEIQHFVDCYSKPYATGLDAFSKGSRVRRFLGDSRSEVFFLESEEVDPRSARILVDIYSKDGRWDDLCYLYRRHEQPVGSEKPEVWNSHYHNIYLSALARSTKPENCALFIAFVESEAIEVIDNPQTRWNYCRALYLSGMNEKADKAKKELLHDENFDAHIIPFALHTLTSLWNSNHTEMKKCSLQFAEDILCIYFDSLPFESVLQIATLDGCILRISSSEVLELLNSINSKYLLMVLSCTHMIDDGVEDPVEHYYHTAEVLIDMLTDDQNSSSSLVMLVLRFLESLSISSDLFDRLNTKLVEYLFTYYWSMPSDQMESILKKIQNFDKNIYLNASIIETCIQLLKDNENNTSVIDHYLVLGTAIYQNAISKSNIEKIESNTSNDDQYKYYLSLSELRQRLFDEWTEYFIINYTRIDAAHWQMMTEFLRNTPSQDQNAFATTITRVIENQEENATDLGNALILLSVLKAECDINLVVRMFSDALSDSVITNEKTITRIFEWIINNDSVDNDELSVMVDTLINLDYYQNDALSEIVYSHMQEKYSPLVYNWYKERIAYANVNSDVISDIDADRLMTVTSHVEASSVIPEQDISILFCAAAVVPSIDNIRLMKRLYQQSGNLEFFRLFNVLESCSENNDESYAVFVSFLNENNVDWLERYSVQWSSYIRLREIDVKINSIISYIGTSEDEISTEIRNSIIRLIMRDLRNPDYIDAFLRIDSRNEQNEIQITESSEHRVKLSYFAVLAKNKLPEQYKYISDFFEKGYPNLGISLLKRQMERSVSNSVNVALMLSRVFTERNIEQYPELIDIAPSIYQWFNRVNSDDPQGKWKNTGRLVDIACLTNTEKTLFEVHSEILEIPGKCAFLCAHMIESGRIADAEECYNKAYLHSPIDQYRYLSIIKMILDDYHSNGTLSEENITMLKFIPKEGNKHSLSFFGELAYDEVRKGRGAIMYRAMQRIYEIAHNDKAFLTTCIQLSSYAVDNEKTLNEVLLKTFEYSKEYLSIVALSKDKLLYEQASYRLCILHAFVKSILPETGINGLLDGTTQDYDSLLHIDNLAEFRLTNTYSSSYFSDKVALFKAATGNWDESCLGLFYTAQSAAEFIMKASYASFRLACSCALLKYCKDIIKQNQIEDALRVGNSLDLLNMVSFSKVSLEENDIEKVLALFEIPIDIPGVFAKVFIDALTVDDSDAAFVALKMLVSSYNSFSYNEYQNNGFHIKETIEETCEDRRAIADRVMIAHFKPNEMKNLAAPKAYLDDETGEMFNLIEPAADVILEKPWTKKNPFHLKLNTAYKMLGQLLTGSMSGKQLKELHLETLMNMTNLLCQSPHYKEVTRLYNLCPAKWRICLRCEQELIQGNPKNVLLVLKRKEFLAKKGCSSYVAKIARDFVAPRDNNGRSFLIEENRKLSREESWGVYSTEEVPLVTTKANAVLLFVLSRNYQSDVSSFEEDIEQMFEEMIRDNEKKQQRSAMTKQESLVKTDLDEDKTTGLSDIREYKKIPFINDMITEYLSDQKNIEKTDEELEPAADSHVEIHEIINPEQLSATEKIEYYTRCIAQKWDREGDTETHWNIVRLGLVLFEEKCDTKSNSTYGMHEVTPEAKNIFLQLSDCLPRVMPPDISAKIISYLPMTLTSYTQLSMIVDDCTKHDLAEWCDAIKEDDRARIDYRSFIELVINIGQNLSRYSTAIELKKQYEEYIRVCTRASNRSQVAEALYRHLAKLLNYELRKMKNSAVVSIEVYNSDCSVQYPILFGMAINASDRTVNRVQLDLIINGIHQNTFVLNKLEANARMPFELSFTLDDSETDNTVSYSISGTYRTSDNTEEVTNTVDGNLNRYDIFERELITPLSYNTTNVNGRYDFVERRNIQKIIEANYGIQNGIERFPDMIIYGMKRTGKTSVLNRIKTFLSDNYEDQLQITGSSGEGMQTTKDYVKMVHSLFVDQLFSSVDSKHNTLSSIYSNTLGWTEFEQKWRHDFVPSADFSWLESFYTELQQKFLNGKKLIVMIDEVDIIIKAQMNSDNISSENENTNLQLSLWGTLSKITQFGIGNVKFLICGADYITNMIIGGDNITQFFQRTKQLQVGRMTPGEITEAMKTIEKRSDIRLHDDTIAYLWQLLGGLPWHSKVIANKIIEERLIEENRAEIYPSDVLWALEKKLTDELFCSDNNLGIIALSDDERKIIGFMATLSVSSNTIVKADQIKKQFVDEIHNENATERFERAIGILCSKRLLLRSGGLEEDRWLQFSCELYRLYQRKVKVLDKFIVQKG